MVRPAHPPPAEEWEVQWGGVFRGCVLELSIEDGVGEWLAVYHYIMRTLRYLVLVMSTGFGWRCAWMQPRHNHVPGEFLGLILGLIFCPARLFQGALAPSDVPPSQFSCVESHNACDVAHPKVQEPVVIIKRSFRARPPSTWRPSMTPAKDPAALQQLANFDASQEQLQQLRQAAGYVEGLVGAGREAGGRAVSWVASRLMPAVAPGTPRFVTVTYDMLEVRISGLGACAACVVYYWEAALMMTSSVGWYIHTPYRMRGLMHQHAKEELDAVCQPSICLPCAMLCRHCRCWPGVTLVGRPGMTGACRSRTLCCSPAHTQVQPCCVCGPSVHDCYESNSVGRLVQCG